MGESAIIPHEVIRFLQSLRMTHPFTPGVAWILTIGASFFVQTLFIKEHPQN